MHTLQIKNLCYKYPNSSAAIFENIDLEFNQGWTALVGSNGSGKSTLLKLISKELYSEETVIKGNDLVYYCHQSTEYPPENLNEFLTTYTSKAFKIRDLLEIEDSWIDRWNDLSHGERKRLQISIALYSECDVLVVDEPTNHLDSKNKEIVRQALKSFGGIGILVSHDRELLDALSHYTVMIKDFKISTFKLGFSFAMQEYENTIMHLQKKQELNDEKIKKLDRTIQTQKEKVSQSKKRTSKKNLGISDSDGREKINLAKLTGKDKNDGQTLKRMQSKQQQLSKDSIVLDKQSNTGINFEVERSKKAFPIVIEPNMLNISNTQRLSFPRLSIDKQDKIALVGDNGSGKSSFVRYFLSQLKFKDTYLYIPQEITVDESKTLLKEVSELPKEQKGEIFTLVKRLSSDPKQLMQSRVPSPGEVRKLLVAKGLLSRPSLIILDEPTNHMDLKSIEALERALQEYDGTVMIISHDKYFTRAVTMKTWSFEEITKGFFNITE